MQRVKLLRSQKILLQMKNERINEALALVRIRQKEFQESLNLVIVEQGISKNEINQWGLVEDAQAIEKIEITETPEKKDEEKEK